jgi:hypothetical protein
MNPSTTAVRVGSIEATDNSPQEKYARWRDEVILSEKEFDTFWTRGRKTVRRFLDERENDDEGARKFNIFTSNVGIMESGLYSKVPKVTVKRRFNQSNDDVGRIAANMLQNCIMQDMEDDECDFDTVMTQCVQDRLVPGLGVAWLRVETDTEENTLEEVIDPMTGEVIQEAASYEKVTRQEVRIEHVNWEDFRVSPCRTWAERRWVGRVVYMDRDSLVKRFGKEKGDKIPLDHAVQKGEDNSPQNLLVKQAAIYELWSRPTRTVVWLSKGYPELLDEVEDPLKLDGFDPCPKPLFALMANSNLIPTNDFVIIQDQYNELDALNNRISMLVEACKAVGAYDAAATGLSKMLTEGTENELVPVDNWAMFAEKGGIEKAISWLPIDVVVSAIDKLSERAEIVKQQIYELTGISDIVRGNTKASETLGAQQLKSQFASVRIQKLQGTVAKFAQAILRLKGELIAKHFVPEQIIKMSNMEFHLEGQNAPLIHQAIQLIKGDSTEFGWRVNVQADSLAEPDYAIRKQEGVEFTTSVATFLQSAATTMKAIPESAPVIFEALKYSVSGFKGSQELEGVIDQTLTKIMQKIENPPPPPPDPAIEKAKLEMQLKQQEAQLNERAMQQEMQIEQQRAEMEMQLKQMELRFKQLEHEMNMAFKQQTNQQQMAQNEEKFNTQVAQDSARAMMQLNKDAREDKKNASDDD